MDIATLSATAKALVAPGKGILAADESGGTIKKRFDSIAVESTEDNRRDYREMLFTTKGVGEYISGVILFDETIRQDAADGTPLVEGARVARASSPASRSTRAPSRSPAADGETVTEGLDGLRERLAEYASLGARFAKWRARHHHRPTSLPDARTASTRTRTRSRATPRCARRRASCRSSSPRC